MHSPVLVNYDPAFETASLPSDWEYYSDDYWDHDPPKKKKRKANNDEAVGGRHKFKEEGARRKRTMLKSTKDVPGLSLGEPTLTAPTVVWKSKEEVLDSFEGMGMGKGHGEKVSLLKDWRERFKLTGKPSTTRPKTESMQRKASQQAIAVLIDNAGLESNHHTTPPPISLSKAQGLPWRSRAFLSPTEETPASLDGAPSGGSLLQDPGHKSERGHLTNGAAPSGRKRKAEHHPNAGTVDTDKSKRRPGRPKKQKVDSVTYGDGSQDDVDEPTTKSRTVKGKESVPENTSGAIPSEKKRKAMDSDDESAKVRAKRNKSIMKSAEAATVATEGGATRRSTRNRGV